MASRATSRSNRACRLIQSCAVVPKYRPRRRAVSAEIPRFSRTISLMRLGGTWISLARRYWLMPSGIRNSSRNISPGCIGGKSLLLISNSLIIVHYFDIVSIIVAPHKTDSPLVIDADAVLADAIIL